MHDIYGTEIYLKYHREDLMQQAEHERQIMKAMRLIAGKAPGQPGKRKVRIQVELTEDIHDIYQITFFTGELK